MTDRPVTMTVTKKFVTAPTTRGTVTLFRGTELSMVRRTDGAYEGVIASGQESTTGTIILTATQAAAWCVFRTAEALGFRP